MLEGYNIYFQSMMMKLDKNLHVTHKFFFFFFVNKD